MISPFPSVGEEGCHWRSQRSPGVCVCAAGGRGFPGGWGARPSPEPPARRRSCPRAGELLPTPPAGPGAALNLGPGERAFLIAPWPVAEAGGGEVTPHSCDLFQGDRWRLWPPSPLEAGCQRPPQGLARPQPWTPLRGPEGAPGVTRCPREPTDTSSLQSGGLAPVTHTPARGNPRAGCIQTCRIGISRVRSPSAFCTGDSRGSQGPDHWSNSSAPIRSSPGKCARNAISGPTRDPPESEPAFPQGPRRSRCA